MLINDQPIFRKYFPLWIIVIFLALGACLYGSRWVAADQPAQANFSIIATRSSVLNVLTKVAESRGEKPTVGLNDFGSKYGKNYEFHLRIDGVSLTAVSSPIGTCLEENEWSDAKDADPKFSSTVYFISIYQESVFDRRTSIDAIDGEIRQRVMQSGGKIVQDVRSCVS